MIAVPWSTLAHRVLIHLTVGWEIDWVASIETRRSPSVIGIQINSMVYGSAEPMLACASIFVSLCSARITVKVNEDRKSRYEDVHSHLLPRFGFFSP